MTGKNNDKIRYVAVGGAVAVVLLSVGAGMAFFFRTLVIWWIPVAVAAAIAGASGGREVAPDIKKKARQQPGPSF